MKLKKNDAILIISGKDKGKKSKVLNVFPKTGEIIAEGINIRKKHLKPKRSGEKGQIVGLPVPLDASNAKLICSKCGKAVRAGFKVEGEKKYRICKKCGQET
jgi:large subunit ribosomal protein L24